MVVPSIFRWEVLIVDNGSTDGTADACKEFMGKNPERFIYVLEPRKGKSIALNNGIRAAKGNILAFTDDDCIVDKHWIEAIMAEYAADPRLGVLGGRVELYDPHDRPLTLVTALEKSVLLSARELFPSPQIIGANMAAKTAVIQSVGGFDQFMGPGTNAHAAEDADFLYQALKKGFKVVYCPSVLVYHKHGRQTDEEVMAMSYQYDVGRGSFYIKHILEGDRKIARMFLGDLKWTLNRILAFKEIKYRTRFLRGLLTGVMSRLFVAFKRKLGLYQRRISS